MSFKKLLVVVLFCLSGEMSFAQTENDPVVEAIIESVMENTGEDFDYSELLERLNFYRRNPININKTSRETLQELMFLSPLQINQILEYRLENGVFIELYELQSISSLDLESIRKLLPFIVINQPNPLSNITFQKLLHNGNSEVMLTSGRVIEKQSGYHVEDEEKTQYLGSPYRFLARYRYHYGENISASLTMEKDAGERLFNKNSSAGFDFYSGSIFYRGNTRVRKAVLGDYSLQFGQGLSLWSGLSFGKGAAIATVARNEIGLKQYTSTNEALFLRGTASTIQHRQFEFTPFVSYRKLDASMAVSDDGDAEIKSLSQNGLHRTSSEIDNRNSSKQLVYGLSSSFTSRSLKLGFIAFHTQFDKAFEKGQDLYNQYDFSGKLLNNLGIFYNYGYKNLYLFGEGAHSIGSGFAFTNGAMLSLNSRLAMVLMHRNYHKDYHSVFNQALSEGSSGVNEKGFYSGLVYTPSRKYEFSSYVDFFRFPWMRFRVDAPSTGFEILSQFTYTPSKRFKTIIRYRFENKEENDDLENALNFLVPVKKQNYRVELSYKLNDKFQVRSRAEVANYQKANAGNELGFLLFQDVIYHPMKSKLSGNIRLALFDTESFNARIYAFENDVLYSFSAPAYQNKGLRFYANTRYRLTRNTDLWLRYAITNYAQLNEIGSGLDKITGNNKSDFKVQIRWQF